MQKQCFSNPFAPAVLPPSLLVQVGLSQFFALALSPHGSATCALPLNIEEPIPAVPLLKPRLVRIIDPYLLEYSQVVGLISRRRSEISPNTHDRFTN